ncbi:MAG: hypothetical protein IKG44_03415 [Mogibacterium sp.]|nr:hypothetical protein [Mogibacterium sp.]
MRKRSDILVSLYVALIAFIAVVGFLHDAKTLVSNEYDIASNIKVLTESDDNNADIKAIATDHINIVLSHGKSWSYSADSKSSITIYNEASNKAGSGGVLVSIMAFSLNDAGYKDFPDYSVIGEAEGKRYIAVYPTDIQFDPENKQAMEDYQAVMQEINKIRNNDAESPVVIKGR